MADTIVTIEPSTTAEELAYMLLEEARLRCKALLDDTEGWAGSDRPDLRALHADLGIAGYYASTRLEPACRKQLLTQAHARCDRGQRSSTGSLRTLANVTAAATRTVESALTATGLLDHMHLAHIHAMSACEALEAGFALQS